jgi:hypothetical protein
MISTFVRFATLGSAAVLLLAASAHAAPIVVTFDSDPTYSFVGDGFTSADSSRIQFSDTLGADLFIANDAARTNGSNALAVLFDDPSALLIELIGFTAVEISMDLGNDIAGLTTDGDEAVLTVFAGGAQVDQVTLALNRNTLMDQTIMYSGERFDSATLVYNIQGGGGLTEAIDNVSVVVPEPGAALVFGVGALLVGAASGQRRGSRAGIHR